MADKGKGKDNQVSYKEGIKIVKDAAQKAWDKTHPKDGSGDEED